VASVTLQYDSFGMFLRNYTKGKFNNISSMPENAVSSDTMLKFSKDVESERTLESVVIKL